MAKIKKSISIGERFRARHNLGRIWQVDDVYADGLRRAHARLHAVETPCEHRTIAVNVLLDRIHYQPIE